MTVEDASKNKLEMSPDTDSTEQATFQGNKNTAVLGTPLADEQKGSTDSTLHATDETKGPVPPQGTQPFAGASAPEELVAESSSAGIFASGTKAETEAETLSNGESVKNTKGDPALAEGQAASGATVTTPDTSITTEKITPSVSEWPVLVDTFSDGESAAKESAEDISPPEEETAETKDEKSKGLGGWSLLKGKSKSKEPAAPKAGKKQKQPKEKKTGEKTPGFFSTHPVQHVDPQQHCLSTTLFNFMALAPWLFLTIILAVQTIFTLDARALWFSDEIRHAAAFTSMLENGKWFVLEMNGQLYADKPPLYFWFVRGVYMLLGKEGPMLYMAVAALSALLYLWASLALGRFVGRLDGRTLLAGGIMLLSCGYMMGVTHYARMDLLFSALIIASHIFMFLAWSKPRSFFFSILGFVFAGLACLVKGPLGLLLPLATSVLFLVWRGKIIRLFKPDVLAGFLVFVIIVAAWAVGVCIETSGTDFLFDEVLQRNILQRATDTFHHKEPWHYYLVRIPLMLLPWTLIIFCLPWHRILSKNLRTAIKASRTPEKEGIAFLWCMILAPIPLLSILSGKILIYYLPALSAVMFLGGRALLQFTPARASFFRILLMIVLILGAIGAVIASLILFGIVDAPAIKGVPQWRLPMNASFYLVAAILLIIAFALWLALRKPSPEGMLSIMAIGAMALAIPLFGIGAPALDEVLSPKEQAQIMGEYAKKGYTPASVKVYGGTYTYYAGTNVLEVNDTNDIAKLIENNQKVVVALKRSTWDSWENRPACLQEIHKQWIETREYVLAVCPADTPSEPIAEPKTQPVTGQPGQEPLLHTETQGQDASVHTPDEAPQRDNAAEPDQSGEEIQQVEPEQVLPEQNTLPEKNAESEHGVQPEQTPLSGQAAPSEQATPSEPAIPSVQEPISEQSLEPEHTTKKGTVSSMSSTSDIRLEATPKAGAN